MCFSESSGPEDLWMRTPLKPTPVSGMKTHYLNNLLCLCILVLHSWQSASRNSSNWKMACLYRALLWYTIESHDVLTQSSSVQAWSKRFGCFRKEVFFFLSKADVFLFSHDLLSDCLSHLAVCYCNSLKSQSELTIYFK